MLNGFIVSKCAILADPRHESARRKIDDALTHVIPALERQGITYESFIGKAIADIRPSEDVQLFLVLGGDGTMIHFAGPLSKLGIPFYGLNYGNVGFMMNSTTGSLDTHARRLREGDFMMWAFPLLEVTAYDLNDTPHRGIGLNDIYLQRMTPQSCKINVSISGEPLAFNPLICDGIIIATPLGSTAYSFNITGSMIAIDAPVITLTPIAANRTCPLSNVNLPMDRKIQLEILEPVKRRTLMVSDGQSHGDVTNAEVSVSPNRAKLCFPASYGASLPMRFINKTKN